MNSKNEFKTFLAKNEEQPRLAVLQRFKDINRVMTDNFLKMKKEPGSSHGISYLGTSSTNMNKKGSDQEDYSVKMIQIMKEMQAAKKFNSPLRRRNLFAKQIP